MDALGYAREENALQWGRCADTFGPSTRGVASRGSPVSPSALRQVTAQFLPQSAARDRRRKEGRVMEKTQLRTTQLGETGLQITRVGFGAWAIGGDAHQFGWGTQADEDSIPAIHHALELGINWIDTAADVAELEGRP